VAKYRPLVELLKFVLNPARAFTYLPLVLAYWEPEEIIDLYDGLHRELAIYNHVKSVRPSSNVVDGLADCVLYFFHRRIDVNELYRRKLLEIRHFLEEAHSSDLLYDFVLADNIQVVLTHQNECDYIS
jgi:hypothetical protein